jgi:hypothetical protein
VLPVNPEISVIDGDARWSLQQEIEEVQMLPHEEGT